MKSKKMVVKKSRITARDGPGLPPTPLKMILVSGTGTGTGIGIETGTGTGNATGTLALEALVWRH